MKRIIGIVFVCLLLCGMTIFGAASMPQKIKSVSPGMLQKLDIAQLDGTQIALGHLTDLEIKPGAELRIYLMGEQGAPVFYDQESQPIPTTDVTMARLLAAQMRVDYLGPDGLVESVRLAYGSPGDSSLSGGAPYICVQFSETLVSVEDIPFSFSLMLSLADQLLESTKMQISGIMKTVERSVSAVEGVFDATDGSVLLAEKDGRIQLLLGRGVSLTTSVTQGEKYYGKVYLEETVKDGESINLYSLYTLNIDQANTTVKIESDSLLYVYDQQARLLGTTREALPYREQYLLSENPRIAED